MRLPLISFPPLYALQIHWKYNSSMRKFQKIKTIILQLFFDIELQEMAGKPKTFTLRVMILGQLSVSVKVTKTNVLGDSPAPNGNPQTILLKLKTLRLSSSTLLTNIIFLYYYLKRPSSRIRSLGLRLESTCLQICNWVSP